MGTIEMNGIFSADNRARAARWVLPLILLTVHASKSAPLPEGVEAAFSTLLLQHVNDAGRVAYRRLGEDPSTLNSYLAALETDDPSALSEHEQVAFWINAYNARVLRGVLDGHRAEGYLGRKRFFTWYTFRLAKQDFTLDRIEHEILRKRFNEPRIHFALVCASTSCPKLRREAYVGARLDAQLEEQTKAFLTDSSRNRIGDIRTIEISRIFDWFQEDFVRAAGSVPI